MIRVKIKSYSAANIQDVPYIAEDDVLIYSNAISSFYCHRLKFSRLSAHIIRRNFINRRNNGNNCLIFLFVSSEFTFRMLPSSSFHFACDSMHLSTYNQMLSFIGRIFIHNILPNLLKTPSRQIAYAMIISIHLHVWFSISIFLHQLLFIKDGHVVCRKPFYGVTRFFLLPIQRYRVNEHFFHSKVQCLIRTENLKAVDRCDGLERVFDVWNIWSVNRFDWP